MAIDPQYQQSDSLRWLLIRYNTEFGAVKSLFSCLALSHLDFCTVHAHTRLVVCRGFHSETKSQKGSWIHFDIVGYTVQEMKIGIQVKFCVKICPSRWIWLKQSTFFIHKRIASGEQYSDDTQWRNSSPIKQYQPIQWNQVESLRMEESSKETNHPSLGNDIQDASYTIKISPTHPRLGKHEREKNTFVVTRTRDWPCKMGERKNGQIKTWKTRLNPNAKYVAYYPLSNAWSTKLPSTLNVQFVSRSLKQGNSQSAPGSGMIMCDGQRIKSHARLFRMTPDPTRKQILFQQG